MRSLVVACRVRRPGSPSAPRGCLPGWGRACRAPAGSPACPRRPPPPSAAGCAAQLPHHVANTHQSPSHPLLHASSAPLLLSLACKDAGGKPAGAAPDPVRCTQQGAAPVGIHAGQQVQRRRLQRPQHLRHLVRVVHRVHAVAQPLVLRAQDLAHPHLAQSVLLVLAAHTDPRPIIQTMCAGLEGSRTPQWKCESLQHGSSQPLWYLCCAPGRCSPGGHQGAIEGALTAYVSGRRGIKSMLRPSLTSIAPK